MSASRLADHFWQIFKWDQMWRRLCLVDCLLIDFNSGAQSMTHSISGNIGNKRGSTYQNEILGHIFPFGTNVLVRLRKGQNDTLHVCASEEHMEQNVAKYNWRIFIQYVHIWRCNYSMWIWNAHKTFAHHINDDHSLTAMWPLMFRWFSSWHRT